MLNVVQIYIHHKAIYNNINRYIVSLLLWIIKFYFTSFLKRILLDNLSVSLPFCTVCDVIKNNQNTLYIIWVFNFNDCVGFSQIVPFFLLLDWNEKQIRIKSNLIINEFGYISDYKCNQIFDEIMKNDKGN